MSEKAVADDTTSASQTTDEDQGAQTEDLDTLLSEIDEDFDKDTKVLESKDEGSNEVADLKKKVDYLLSQTSDVDIDKAVDVVSQSLGDIQAPKRAIRGMLNEMASEDPRLLRAFENRRQDPKSWNRVLKAATKNIQKEFSDLPDRQLTDDRESVAATIRGASKTASDDDAPNFANMTDQQFEEYKQKHG